jgi:type II secretory pathway component GspD/PulD (secretin)
VSENRQDRHNRYPTKYDGDALRHLTDEDLNFGIGTASEEADSNQELAGAFKERQESVNHYLNKTVCLIVATLMVSAVLLGKLRSGSADEPAASQRASRSTGPEASFNRPAAPTRGNHIMRRLPPILVPVEGDPRVLQFNAAREASGELPEFLTDERRLFERGSIVNWHQDPANHSKAVRLLSTQDGLGAVTRHSAQGAVRPSTGELPVPANTEPVTLHLNEVSVRLALEMLSRSHGLSILVAPGVAGQVTANLEGLPVDQALNAIIKLANLVAHREGGLIYVYSATEFPQANFRLQVFPLDFVSSIDVLPVVTNLLTPTGQATASSVDEADNTKAREAVVVTDRPEILERVAAYLRQVDVPPLQVMIEAHVLQVDLGDDCRHGINYKQAIDAIGSSGVELEVTGFAETAASPAIFARIAGAKVQGLLEFLKTTTDAKTLASPRVMVINGQKARIQVGEQIPYKVVTVTETTAIEDIRFLDVGVVLEVTPRISRDGRVMLRVKPKVSTSTFNPDIGLPGEATRELESDVLLEDGLGVVIGGLIQERDVEIQKKFPYLGDLHYVGRLFQKREVFKERSEIVITLVPRIMYSSERVSARDLIDAERSQSPLFYGPLNRATRPWEPQLPDAVNDPIKPGTYRLSNCRNCQHSPCDCAYNQPAYGTEKPLVPTPITSVPALAPPQQERVLPTETPSTVPQLGPPPVHIQPVSAVGPANPGVAEESYRSYPRTLQ